MMHGQPIKLNNLKGRRRRCMRPRMHSPEHDVQLEVPGGRAGPDRVPNSNQPVRSLINRGAARTHFGRRQLRSSSRVEGKRRDRPALLAQEFEALEMDEIPQAAPGKIPQLRPRRCGRGAIHRGRRSSTAAGASRRRPRAASPWCQPHPRRPRQGRHDCCCCSTPPPPARPPRGARGVPADP